MLAETWWKLETVMYDKIGSVSHLHGLMAVSRGPQNTSHTSALPQTRHGNPLMQVSVCSFYLALFFPLDLALIIVDSVMRFHMFL